MELQGVGDARLGEQFAAFLQQREDGLAAGNGLFVALRLAFREWVALPLGRCGVARPWPPCAAACRSVFLSWSRLSIASIPVFNKWLRAPLSAAATKMKK
jgi:hypothetical protein